MVHLRSGLNWARDAVRTQLWPLPTAGVVVAVGLGIALPRVDGRVDSRLPSWTGEYLFSGDANAARTLLDSVAGSLITVTSLTFMLTVVTLQLASGQFSPRLLRTFTRDVFVQATLALFLATFTYALTVLRSVRTAAADQALFVPRLSVTIGFVLAVASVLGLVLFLAHLTQQIRVETMLRDVHDDAADTAQRVFGAADPDKTSPVVPRVPADALVALSPKSGFLLLVDQQELLKAATEADAVIVIESYPGSSMIAGTPFAFTWPRGGGRFDADTEHLQRRIGRAATVGFERTPASDVELGLRQITDVAIKALSPGINDPTTAVHALSHSAALLCALAGRDLGPVVLVDGDGAVRVVLRRPDLADFLELAMAQPRRYGAADPAVLARLLQLLRELAWCSEPKYGPVVSQQLDRLRETIRAQDFDPTESARLAELGERVESALSGRWPSSSDGKGIASGPLGR